MGKGWSTDLKLEEGRWSEPFGEPRRRFTVEPCTCPAYPLFRLPVEEETASRALGVLLVPGIQSAYLVVDLESGIRTVI